MKLYDRIAGLAGEQAAGAAQAAFDRALAQNRPALTQFLDSKSCDAIKSALFESAEAVYRTYGGYRGSSRAKVAIAPVGYDWEGFEPEIGYFCIKAPDAGVDEMLTYIKAAGVQESELGDLFLSGADVCGVASVQAAEKLASKGIDVRGLPFAVKVVDPYDIALPGQQAKPIRATVNSMRFDAVAACGFPASRTRLAAEIELGRAKLNGRVVTDSAAKIKLGDVIVMRGRGRLTVDEEGPITKKGRLSIRISRYSVI